MENVRERMIDDLFLKERLKRYLDPKSTECKVGDKTTDGCDFILAIRAENNIIFKDMYGVLRVIGWDE